MSRSLSGNPPNHPFVPSPAPPIEPPPPSPSPAPATPLPVPPVARHAIAPVEDSTSVDDGLLTPALAHHVSHQESDNESGGDDFDLILDNEYNQEIDYYMSCDISRLNYIIDHSPYHTPVQLLLTKTSTAFKHKISTASLPQPLSLNTCY